jgi:hypothetical protein
MINTHCVISQGIETAAEKWEYGNNSPSWQQSDLKMSNCGFHRSCVVLKVVEFPFFFNSFAFLPDKLHKRIRTSS